MTISDPTDARILAALAEVGKAAVHEIAARVGMDPRDVAYRLVGMSGHGLPLLVGVESDPNGLRAALANNPPAPSQHPGGRPPAHPSTSGPHPPPAGTAGPPPAQPGTSGPHAVNPTSSGPHPVHPASSGPHQVPPSTSGPRPVGTGPPLPQPPSAQQRRGWQQPPAPPRQPPAPRAPQHPPAQSADPTVSTWGPPQSALWARSDQPSTAAASATTPAAPQQPPNGKVGDVLESTGLEGESLAIQLLEVQDPADFLFGAGGYQLAENERAIVVHSEFTNKGQVPFASLPDNYLELVTDGGETVEKDPMSLTSRPPHKIGLAAGETASGHTIYLVRADTGITAVRWSPRPEPDNRTCTWTIER